MLAEMPNKDTTAEREFSVYETDPNQQIVLSEDRDFYDNYPTPLTTTYAEFFAKVSRPDPAYFSKDGPGWLNGPCRGRRAKTNFDEFWMAVFDADGSLDKAGNKVDGAPDPETVHLFLSSIGITHQLHTTFSHSGLKGNRFRILFPVHAKSAAELRGLLLYVTESMQLAGINIYLTPESYRVPNRWHYPRLAHRDAPFYAATYWGNTLSPGFLAWHYHQVDAQNRPIHSNLPEVANTHEEIAESLIGRFCQFVSIPELLEQHGYTFRGQQVLVDSHGHENNALRYLPPGSTSAPGVIVFEHANRQRVYSHHTNDPLSGGVARDAYDAYMLLNGVDYAEQFETARQIVEDCEIDEMNKNWPSVYVGGRLRYARRVLDAADGYTYQFRSPQDVKDTMGTMPGVFVLAPSKDDPTKMETVYRERYQWWSTHRRRVTYESMKFRPLPMLECAGRQPFEFHQVVDGRPYFNSFPGWRVEPKKGNCDLIKWHIKHALCSGNEEHYEYFMMWLAHILQHPADKPRVAPVLRGSKGIGKTMISQALINAMSPMGVSVSNTRSWTSNFNALFSDKILVVLEESFFSGSPTEDSILKTMITDGVGTTERKFAEAEASRTFYRVMVITNNLWAVPASDDERRYFVPTTSSAAIDRNLEEGGGYFVRLNNDLSGPAMRALLDELAHWPVDVRNISKAPESAELKNQKMYALNGLDSWVADFLTAGFLTPGDGRMVRLVSTPRKNEVAHSVLLASSASYATRYDTAKAKTFRVLQCLERYFGECPISYRADDSYVMLPALDVMREQFARTLGIEVRMVGGPKQ